MFLWDGAESGGVVSCGMRWDVGWQKSNQGKRRKDKARQDKARQDKTRQDKTRLVRPQKLQLSNHPPLQQKETAQSTGPPMPSSLAISASLGKNDELEGRRLFLRLPLPLLLGSLFLFLR